MKFFCLAIMFLVSALAYGQSAQSLFVEAGQMKREGRTQKAIRTYEEALTAAKKEQNIPLQMKCHLELAELENNVVYYKSALKNYQEFTRLYRQSSMTRTNQLTDSVQSLKSEVDSGEIAIKAKNVEIDSLSAAQLRTQLNVQRLEMENERAAMKLERESNQQKQLLFILAFGFLALIFILFEYLRKRKSTLVLRVKNNEIKTEKAKSDSLLLNILPTSVAEELKEFGKTSSFHYDEVTVMFTDFKGFTTFAEQNNPEDVVAMLDYYFRGFDAIISHYPIEKIKTIGDAYLCVSGAPEPNKKHASNMVQTALYFQEFVKSSQSKKFGKGSELLEMRIGLHTGPIVAGVVGSKKFAYDVWGDTVNIAARMEQSGEIGKINVSETVVAACGNDFDFHYRGELEAKNRGKLKMYFVET